MYYCPFIALSFAAFRCAYCYHLNPAKEKKPSTATNKPDEKPAPRQALSENKPVALEEIKEATDTQ